MLFLFQQRTHTCGQLTKEDTGKKVVLNGWVDRIRNLGGLIFVLVRDRYGKTQVFLTLMITRSI